MDILAKIGEHLKKGAAYAGGAVRRGIGRLAPALKAGAKKAGFHTWRVTTKPSWPSILEGLSYYGIKIEI